MELGTHSRRQRKKTKHDPAAVGHRVVIPSPGAGCPAGQEEGEGLARSERAARLAGDPLAQLGLLPPMHNLVGNIVAERWCNAYTDAVSKQRHRAVQSQLQYLVQWMPTIEEQWSLDAHLQLGYAPDTCTPITWGDLIEMMNSQALRLADKELYEQL